MTDCLTEGPYALKKALSEREQAERNVLAVVNLLEYPDELPASYDEREVELAERILEEAISREGHHTEIQHKMEAWGNEVRDDPDVPDFYRRHVFGLSPRERHMGTLEGDAVLKKAATVIAWGRAEYGDRFVDRIRAELLRDARNAWRDEIEAAHERAEEKRFERSPPDEYGNWSRVASTHDHVRVAYKGLNYGTPSVAAVFEDEEEDLEAQEFTVERWNDAGGDPREARQNRPIRLVSNGKSVWGDLKRHLDTFDVEPLPDSPAATEPFSAEG